MQIILSDFKAIVSFKASSPVEGKKAEKQDWVLSGLVEARYGLSMRKLSCLLASACEERSTF